MNYTDPAQFRQAAKIDFLKIRLPSSIRQERDAYEFSKNIKGRIEVAKKWKSQGEQWITIHDATAGDLDFLVTHHPDVEVLGIEVAVDFFLRDGSSDKARLIGLYADLRHCLFPQKADALKDARRKHYDEQSRKIERDALRTRAGVGSIYWAAATGYVQTRLYWKAIDNKQSVAQQSVRVEATFQRGGCQDAHLYTVADLPTFFGTLRKRCAPMMHVAEGIKPATARCRANTPEAVAKHHHEADKEQRRVARAWTRYGSAWAAKHGYSVIPDTAMNRAIGDALNNLQRSLFGLTCVTKKREHLGYDLLETPVNTEVRGLVGQGSIEGVLPSPSTSVTISSTPSFASPYLHETETLVEVEVDTNPSILSAGHVDAEVEATAETDASAVSLSLQVMSLPQHSMHPTRCSLTLRPRGASARSGRVPPAIPSLSNRSRSFRRRASLSRSSPAHF